MSKDEILSFLSSHKDEMHKKFGLIKIGLFGSYAKDNFSDKSDIDLAVEIKSQDKFRSFFALKDYLEKNLRKKVDLGIESNIKQRALKQIKKEIIYV